MAEFRGAAGAAITDSEGRILLVKRCDCGKWGIPGGLMEFGETMAQTAVREAKEETGLDIVIDSLVGVYSGYFSRTADRQPITCLFAAHAVGGELYCDHIETAELRYFGKDELPEIYSPQHIDMLRDFFTEETGFYR
ncbi:ADP-ribose pyrophosphatase YjhB, NUDIX family [Ruminococcus sp. YE71]|uniref:NUDIX domain-containing protein n=1 Tax=unclassified Ruminococcus TaxID=2608920 RepID=UPI0008875FB7|nr:MULTISPECIES: NUDIX domain-containing protein [unclassified Ruminococcus]SDA14140.1 ADP-ribose pyrophosphatase YjhB, NUDIX family [Ruminococcus sp. YE78]SFW20627.1 ADP-ribose pyrophosphatase YjhB, NUDIX family [Ruminococcus sp. YE71]